MNLPLWFYIYEELIHTIVFTPSLTVNFRIVIYNSEWGEVAFCISQHCRGLSGADQSQWRLKVRVSTRRVARGTKKPRELPPSGESCCASSHKPPLFGSIFHFRRHIPGSGRGREGQGEGEKEAPTLMLTLLGLPTTLPSHLRCSIANQYSSTP